MARNRCARCGPDLSRCFSLVAGVAAGARPRPPIGVGYLQPGVVVVWPGGWHLPTCGAELPAPPPLLPGPKAGSAIEAGTIADVAINARAARPTSRAGAQSLHHSPRE